jgi:DNA-binding CsgD family transcriptional regulator
VLNLTDELIESLKEPIGVSKQTGEEAPEYAESLLRELTFMSLGYMERESAATQGISLDAVKFRKRKAKEILGTRTKHDTVVEVIQRRLIAIEPEKNPSYEKLAPIERSILHLMARGWIAEVIAQKYGIVHSTVKGNPTLLVQSIERK